MHLVFSNVASQLAHLSKCQFTQVAAIAVDDSGRIKATGVNGTPSGTPNCCDVHFDKRDDHKTWSDDYEIHAEMNMIEDLARSGYKPSHLTIYTTHSPCKNCLKHLVGLVKKTGSETLLIDKIVYGIKYHRLSQVEMNEMKQYCAQAGIQLIGIEEIESEF